MCVKEKHRGADILAVVRYPVSVTGTGSGSVVDLGLRSVDFPVPDVTVSLADFEESLGVGEAFFSDPVTTTDPDRQDYVVAIPAASDAG